jgi:hypothetical protein
MEKLMKLLIIPLIITVIGSLVAVYFEYYLDKNDESVLTIHSEHDALVITNNTTNMLYIRVAYSIVEGGSSTYCYPNPTAADGDNFDDPILGPGATEAFPPRHCHDWNGYQVWAWNNQRELMFEAEG